MFNTYLEEVPANWHRGIAYTQAEKDLFVALVVEIFKQLETPIEYDLKKDPINVVFPEMITTVVKKQLDKKNIQKGMTSEALQYVFLMYRDYFKNCFQDGQYVTESFPKRRDPTSCRLMLRMALRRLRLVGLLSSVSIPSHKEVSHHV